MFPIHTILHPTDFSDRANEAFRLAAAVARDYGARLVLFHVVPPAPAFTGEMGVAMPPEPESVEEFWAKLNDLRAEGDLCVERSLVRGDPAEEIVRRARDEKADLIVMGTHGRTGLGRLLMGSVAELVMRRAPCPVLTVKVPVPAPVREEREPVLATPM